jgi:hypothetical protein
MAFEDLGKCISLEVNADLSASQYCFVKLASGQAALCGTGQEGIGVLQNDPNAANRAGDIAIDGISKVKAGGTLTAGQNVGSDSTGRAVTPTTGQYILGKVLESAATNEIVACLLVRGTAKA